MRQVLLAVSTVFLVSFLASSAFAKRGELIPREVIFGNPERASPVISHDGRTLAWLQPLDGVLNVWVAPVDDLTKARAITKDTHRGIRSFFWAYDGQHILYIQDKGGDENWRIYSVDVESGDEKDLTPFEGVRANIEGVSHLRPKQILIGLNDRNPQFHDLHLLNIDNGDLTLVMENPGVIGGDAVQGWVTDDRYNVRYAVTATPDGGSALLSQSNDSWETFQTIPMEDDLGSSPVGFDADGRKLYMRDSRKRSTAALVEIDTQTGRVATIAKDADADIIGVMSHPLTNEVQAVISNYDRQRWQFFDREVERDIERLRELGDGDISITSRTLDDTRWVVAMIDDDGPVRYYLYDRETQEPSMLFVNRPELEGRNLAKMHPVKIKSRDGLTLVSYLTLPTWADEDENGRPDASPLPMMLWVHGGPWARDSWGYNSIHQWLANRGYAVLSVNFRGSTGFGKAFVNAGNKQWSKTMHDDLIDAVDWAIEEGIADPDLVAIGGGSYGGYATLAGLTFTPEKFACGVDIVGPSNLITLLNTIPPYWLPAKNFFKARMGDIETPEGRIALRNASPLTHVDEIIKPLLIGQGANDPRVKQAESDQIVEAMNEKNIPVTYVLYPDEGHGFARPENRMSFYAVAEAFLAQHLGGEYEEIGDDFDGSTIEVPAGADQVPGVSGALDTMSR
ncbi:MAG: S9 family peptidase [Planctomycetota bacterium]